MVLNMAMTHKKRMNIITSATPMQYFAMLNETKQMSRNERSALQRRGVGLKRSAIEDSEIRQSWNEAAVESGHKDQMFKVSIG